MKKPLRALPIRSRKLFAGRMTEATDLDREERKAPPARSQLSSRGNRSQGQTQSQSRSSQGITQSQGYSSSRGYSYKGNSNSGRSSSQQRGKKDSRGKFPRGHGHGGRGGSSKPYDLAPHLRPSQEGVLAAVLKTICIQETSTQGQTFNQENMFTPALADKSPAVTLSTGEFAGPYSSSSARCPSRRKTFPVHRPLGEGLRRFSRSRGCKVRRVIVLPGQTNTPSTSGVVKEARKTACRVAEARRHYAVERSCGVSPATITGLLQQHVSGPQEERRDETGHQLEVPQHLGGEGKVQDGDPASHPQGPLQGQMGRLHRSQGRLLPCSDQGSSKEVPALHSQGDGLPVSGSPLWPYHSTEGVYQSHGNPGINSPQERYQPSPLPERLPTQSQLLSEGSDPYEGVFSRDDSVGLHRQPGQVRTDSDTTVFLSGRGLRPSPGHSSSNLGEGRQDPYSMSHSPEASLSGSPFPTEGAGSPQRSSRCHPSGQTPHETTSTRPPQPVVHVHTTFVLQGVSEHLLPGAPMLVERSTEFAARTTPSVTEGDRGTVY